MIVVLSNTPGGDGIRFSGVTGVQMTEKRVVLRAGQNEHLLAAMVVNNKPCWYTVADPHGQEGVEVQTVPGMNPDRAGQVLWTCIRFEDEPAKAFVPVKRVWGVKPNKKYREVIRASGKSLEELLDAYAEQLSLQIQKGTLDLYMFDSLFPNPTGCNICRNPQCDSPNGQH